jgi:hypothetical protein
MPDAADLRRILLNFARAVRFEAEALFDPVFALEIVRDDARHLVLKNRQRELSLDRRFGTVKSGTRVLTRFRDVQAIEVTCQRARGGEPMLWSVRLRLGWFSTLSIGRTHDDVHASIVAARLSTMTGKPVRADRC